MYSQRDVSVSSMTKTCGEFCVGGIDTILETTLLMLLRMMTEAPSFVVSEVPIFGARSLSGGVVLGWTVVMWWQRSDGSFVDSCGNMVLWIVS